MTEIILSTVPYETCKKELIQFRNANRESERDEKYFDWRYLDGPAGLNPVIVWAEALDGTKIGVLSLIPRFYMVDNHLCPIGVLGDISVSSQWRGKGVSKKMFHYLTGLEEVRKLMACIVLPNEEAAKPLEQSGWKTITKLERYVKILNIEEKLFNLLPSRRLSGIVAIPVNVLLNIFFGESQPSGMEKYKGEFIKEFDERFDHLWRNLEKRGLMIGLRDRKALSWRYAGHPIIKYQIFILTQDDKLCGYIIFYICDRGCYIDDVLCIENDESPTILFSFFISKIRENKNISSISIRTNENKKFVPLTKFGFIKRPDHQKFMIFSDPLINPEHTRFVNGSYWILMAGDKDV